MGLWGSARWRQLAYQNGAFWAGLLHGWRPNYTAQPVVMFASYGWLHAGPGHLIGNLGVLVWLGRPKCWRGSARWGFPPSGGPACGWGRGLWPAHLKPRPDGRRFGALFGLAGAWLVEEVRRTHGLRARLLRGGLLLVARGLNAAAWALQGGHLAWETHLGGMTAGMAFAGLWRGRNADGRPDKGTPVPGSGYLTLRPW